MNKYIQSNRSGGNLKNEHNTTEHRDASDVCRLSHHGMHAFLLSLFHPAIRTVTHLH